MSVLKALHLKKTYKKRTVVSDVSLSVSSGSVVGLLGPNGAGKTTSFYMIVGIISSEEGQGYKILSLIILIVPGIVDSIVSFLNIWRGTLTNKSPCGDILIVEGNACLRPYSV